MYRSIAKVEAVDRYTVRFTLKEPFAWFLDMLANPMTGAIIARECVEKFGDLKKPEAVIGTGPWMLEAYNPNTSLTLVRNPNYFVAGLPYIDRVEPWWTRTTPPASPRSWPASTISAGRIRGPSTARTGCRSPRP